MQLPAVALKSNIGAAKSTGSAEKFVTCNGRVSTVRLKSCWLDARTVYS